MREETTDSVLPPIVYYVGLISAYSEQFLNFGTIPGSIMTLDTLARSDARRRKDLHIRDVPCPFSISQSLETFGGILVFGAIRWSIMTLVAPVVIRCK